MLHTVTREFLFYREGNFGEGSFGVGSFGEGSFGVGTFCFSTFPKTTFPKTSAGTPFGDDSCLLAGALKKKLLLQDLTPLIIKLARKGGYVRVGGVRGGDRGDDAAAR